MSKAACSRTASTYKIPVAADVPSNNATRKSAGTSEATGIL